MYFTNGSVKVYFDAIKKNKKLGDNQSTTVVPFYTFSSFKLLKFK